MSNSDTKKHLKDIVESVTKNATVISDINGDNKIIIELVNTIYQRVEDMSKKFDEVLNTGLKTPRVSPVKSTDVVKKKKTPVKKEGAAEAATAEPKIIKNIMTYFKVKYMNDQKFFDDILEENQASALFEEHKDELNGKKEPNKIKSQASILYKNLNKTQKKKLREMMLDENDSASINKDDDIEEESE